MGDWFGLGICAVVELPRLAEANNFVSRDAPFAPRAYLLRAQLPLSAVPLDGLFGHIQEGSCLAS